MALGFLCIGRELVGGFIVLCCFCVTEVFRGPGGSAMWERTKKLDITIDSTLTVSVEHAIPLGMSLMIVQLNIFLPHSHL